MIRSTISQSPQQASLTDLSPADSIRYLVAQCKELASHYYTAPTAVLERAWWQSLYIAGIRLRDTLEAHQGRWDRLCLTDKEVEHAYYTLMRVAYFFEPGGVAETVFQEQGWVWSDDS